ncbi:MAG: aldehyde ferredoxin oxidoreductase family protein [Dehalococcoidales bacterium]|nr:aldehyde ferredoxin oxidoreductase family protein [Dehalococcoidales bacterium]
MPFGYAGKILRVDMTRREIKTEEPDDAFYRTYFGGTNFVAYYLLKEVKPGVDPLGPENKLIFAAGPITGAAVGGSGRNTVGARSPLTGAFGDAQGGGFFGAELKQAGYDAIVVEGRADKPVYLLVGGDKVELRDASHLWGKTTAETEDSVRAEVGERGLRFAAIGPGGENMVRYAAVLNDLSHACGRTGMGAVMGSKKLKAIAARGRGRLPVADPDKVRELAKWMVENWKKYAYSFHDVGTAGTVRALHVVGGLPTRNFQLGHFDDFEPISGETLRDTVLVRRGSCFACPIHCKREVQVGPPWNVGPLYGGPEYETLGSFGSVCGVDDLGAICKANELCNALGIDTISTGMSIAFAMECFENGLLSEQDTDGLHLTFGNAQAMVKMIEKIAYRRGFGAILAEGVKRAAEAIGGRASEFAMHIKGQELPMHEPRLKQGLGIGYAVSPTGADHVHNIHDTAYTAQNANVDRLNSMGVLGPLPASDLSERKVRVLYYDGVWKYATNTFVTCNFVPWSPEKMTELFNAVTGWNSTYLELHNVGLRSVYLPRIFNLREGFTSADDTLPRRLFQKFESGPLAGVGVDEEQHRKAVRLYYDMMGWDEEGVPLPGRLAQLGIGWAADQLPSRSDRAPQPMTAR